VGVGLFDGGFSPMGDVAPNFSPSPMPLAKVFQPITFTHGPFYVVLAFSSFPCVIMISTSIPIHPIEVFRAYGPPYHQCMLRV
jgi:hypothetical protein